MHASNRRSALASNVVQHATFDKSIDVGLCVATLFCYLVYGHVSIEIVLPPILWVLRKTLDQGRSAFLAPSA
jgi:hypothetical protein